MAEGESPGDCTTTSEGLEIASAVATAGSVDERPRPLTGPRIAMTTTPMEATTASARTPYLDIDPLSNPELFRAAPLVGHDIFCRSPQTRPIPHDFRNGVAITSRVPFLFPPAVLPKVSASPFGRNHFPRSLLGPSPRRGGLGRGGEWQIDWTILPPPRPSPPRGGRMTVADREVIAAPFLTTAAPRASRGPRSSVSWPLRSPPPTDAGRTARRTYRCGTRS